MHSNPTQQIHNVLQNVAILPIMTSVIMLKVMAPTQSRGKISWDTFTKLFHSRNLQARVFVPGRPFQPNLMFAGKVRRPQTS
jgi:hypothetical protein